MPFAGFENFDACITAMQKDGKTEDDARHICGKLQADHERQNSIERPSLRELRSNLISPKIQEIENGLLIKDVKLLSSGIWTDSNIQTPLYYPPKTLEKHYNNWMDNSLWSRHSGGSHRNITDKIGEVRNLSYDEKTKSIIGDLWLHNKTQTSRDVSELIKSGLVNYVSVEHGGKERWNSQERRYEAEELVFSGVAVVNRGACGVCTIQKQHSHSLAEATEKMTENPQQEAKQGLEGASNTIKELEQQLKEKLQATQKTDVDILEKQLEAAKTQKINQVFTELEAQKKQNAELQNRIIELERLLSSREHDDRVKELQRQIEALSKEPVYHTLSNVNNSERYHTSTRQLEIDTDEFPAYSVRDME